MLNLEEFVITPNPELPFSQDYQALRAKGIEYLQKMSSNIWTDLNVHDPGITILELLCYAITDLGYRTHFDISDLLNLENDNQIKLKNSFYKPNEIFYFNPVTINDYRRLFLEKLGNNIMNVGLHPLKKEYSPTLFISKNYKDLTYENTNTSNPLSLLGLYSIKIELNQTKDFSFNVPTSIEKNKVKSLAKEIYSNYRNLCEDFECISITDHEYVGICADFELNKDADPILVKKSIYKAINQYISPNIPRYTINQLINKGKSTEEIFQGVVPKHGFIDDEELNAFIPKNTLYVSDVINLLMDIKGINSIKKFHFSSYKLLADGINIDVKNPIHHSEKYCLHIQNPENAFRFRLDILDDSADKNRINKFAFYFNDLHVPIRIKDSDVKFEEIVPEVKHLSIISNEMAIPKGQFRNLEKYYSIQNEFPEAYLLGKEGISDTAPQQRKAQRLQLKGYLTFFEQIMADYLSQLSHIGKLLSWGGTTIEKTYYSQKLSNDEIKEFDKIKGVEYENIFSSNIYFNKVIGINDNEKFDRKNRFLNHMLARFNDSFVEFSIAQFIKHSTNNSYKHAEIIRDKKDFLSNYPDISGNRLKASNYSLPFKWSSYNVSGFEKRVAKKIGLSKTFLKKDVLLTSIAHPKFDTNGVPRSNLFIDNRNNPFDQSFGFHLIEHVILRPYWGKTEEQLAIEEKINNLKQKLLLPITVSETKKINDEIKILDQSLLVESLLDICEDPDNFPNDCFCRDPYSFKATVVLPGWLPISMDMSFRAYIEKLFREECPAHISLKICWLGTIEMFEFEKNYACFLKKKSAFAKKINCYIDDNKVDESYIKSLNNFIATIKSLNNTYPPSFLIECEDLEIDPKNNTIIKQPIILGKSALFGHEQLKNQNPVDIWDLSIPSTPIDEKQQKLEKIFFEKL